MSTKASAQVRAFVVAVFVALLAFAVFYNAFLQAFIQYWEWQHDGRPMKFTFWADERALPVALLACALVFFFTFRHFQPHDS
jgi:uncharacterized BrkB/YihY/UPF0761 family membrane protein